MLKFADPVWIITSFICIIFLVYHNIKLIQKRNWYTQNKFKLFIRDGINNEVGMCDGCIIRILAIFFSVSMFNSVAVEYIYQFIANENIAIIIGTALVFIVTDFLVTILFATREFIRS